MRPSPIFVALAFAFSAAALPAFAHDHTQHEHAQAAAKPAAAPAQRWATDAPLRAGMARVRSALDMLAHHEMGHMGEAQAREQAIEVQGAIQSMFETCKLAPEPDAALHAILVPLLTAAQQLDKNPADKASVAAMRKAVAPYSTQFDDPNWPATQPAPAEHAH